MQSRAGLTNDPQARCRNMPSVNDATRGYHQGIEPKFDMPNDMLRIILDLNHSVNMPERKMWERTMHHLLMASAIAVLGATTALAQEFTVQEKDAAFDKTDYSPFVDQNYPDRVFWGDTHLHTSNSPDAGLVGNTLGPDMAYRFARGEEVTSATGLRVKLKRPLDFLVVADHSEYMGLAPMLKTGDPALLADPTGKRWYDMFNAGQAEAYNAFREVVQSVTEGKQLIENGAVMRTVWESNNATADEFNEPKNLQHLSGMNGVLFRTGTTSTGS